MNKEQPTRTTVDQDRRRLLKESLLAVCALAGVRWHPLYASAAAATLHTRSIPSSGEQIPIVGLGTSDAFETASGADPAPQRRVLRAYFERGGRLIDTAPSYGNAEAVVGRLAHDLEIRDELFIASKVDRSGEQAGVARMESSQQRLGGRPLDLLQVHNLIDVERQLTTLKRWKEAGRVRYIGITHYRTDAFDDLAKLMRTHDLDFVQFNYSILTPEAERRLLPLAAERGQAVLVNRAYEDGRWFSLVADRTLPGWTREFDCASWGQFALKYVLAHPAVTCVIPATSKIDHLIDNMGAGIGRLPDAAQRARMRELVADV